MKDYCLNYTDTKCYPLKETEATRVGKEANTSYCLQKSEKGTFGASECAITYCLEGNGSTATC